MKRLHESSLGVPFSCTCGTRDPRLVHVHDAYDCSSTQKLRKAGGRSYFWASALVRKAVRDAAAAAAGGDVLNSNSVQFKLKFGIGASAAAVEAPAPAPAPALEPKGFVGSPNYSTSGTVTSTDGDDHLPSQSTPILTEADDSVGAGSGAGPEVAMSDQAGDGFQFSMPPLEEYEKLLLEYPSLDPLFDDYCKITSDGTWCPRETSPPRPTDSSFLLEDLISIPSPAPADVPVINNIRVGEDLISRGTVSDQLDTGQDAGIGGSEQRGLEIVNRLKYCALAISRGEVVTAHQHVQRLEQIMNPTGSSIERVATYFTEALSVKLDHDQGSNGCSNGSNFSFKHRSRIRPSSNFKHAYFKLACQEFDRWCPYLKFSHFTANQAILEAFEGEENLHILDLDVRQGLQWPSLLKELSLRSKGPPRVRMTVVVGATPADLAMDDVQATMQRILDFADTLDLPLAYNILNMSVDDLLPETVDVKEGEVLAVNCVSSLYRRMAHRHPSSSLNNFLSKIRRLTPSVVTVVEGSANHDEDFYERFNGALQYYCSMFDSLAASGLARMPVEREMVERFLLGADITTLVLREGLSCSTELDGHRSATSCKYQISADYWIQQMSKVGFRLRPVSSFSFSQAWLLLWRAEYQGSNYSLMKPNDGCLSLGWAATPLYWVSSWCWC